MNNMKEIVDFDTIKLNREEYSRQVQYFSKYYNDCFKWGQGTDRILDIVREYCPGGRWLDVGCGSATLFWALVTRDITEINCADLSAEALKVLYDFTKSNSIPKCYADVMNIYDVNESVLEQNRAKIKNYYTFDSLRKWPDSLLQHRFDFLTQFGVFGLSKTQEEYIECFSNLKGALKENGICIGANWVLSNQYAQVRAHNNSYISLELVHEACKRYGLTILACGESGIENDDDYDKVVFWAVKAQSIEG